MIPTIPFNAEWITSDKLDIKAIYRRPRLDRFKQRVRDEAGQLAWDYTTPLPIRRHLDWSAKGFEYVSLATIEDLGQAAQSIRNQGGDPNIYRPAFHPATGAFRVQEFQADTAEQQADARAELEALVARFGPDAVEAIRRQSDPGFTLPAELRGEDEGGEKRKPGRPRTAAAGAVA